MLHAFTCLNIPSSTESGDIFQVHLAGSALRAASFPGRVGPSLRHVSFYVFSLLNWGRPSGCIIPKPLGSDPVACIVRAFTQASLLFMLNLSVIITCLIVTYHGSCSRWHGACAWVRPCNVDKSEWTSSGPRQPRKRHLIRPSVPSPLSEEPMAGWLP